MNRKLFKENTPFDFVQKTDRILHCFDLLLYTRQGKYYGQKKRTKLNYA